MTKNAAAAIRLMVAFAMTLTNAAAPVRASTGHVEEMLFGEIGSVVGTITRLERGQAPVSVTTITAEDIRLSPARNLLDLIETYVPGAMTMSYFEGFSPVLRGLTDRSNKFLLLVNGVSLNQKAHVGADTELENWDMGDIEKIEVIRGPGSVTYGPGAVAGVISITTKSGESAPGTQVRTLSNFTYRSEGMSLSHGRSSQRGSLYLYGSFTGSSGVTPRKFATRAVAAGNIGDPGEWPAGGDANQRRQPQGLFTDFDEKPQIKAHVQGTFLDDWKYFLRFTNSGGPRQAVHIAKGATELGDVKGNHGSTRMSQATASLKNESRIGQSIKLQSRIFAFSNNHLRRILRSPGLNAGVGTNDVNNMVQAFSEDQLGLRTLANFRALEKAEFSAGVEYYIHRFGAPWGRSGDDMLFGENPYIAGAGSTAIISGPSSHWVNLAGIPAGNIFHVGKNGWSTRTLSFLGEANVKLHPLANIIFSARTDNNSHTRTMFSPRLAFLSNWSNGGTSKVILQRSVRSNTATQLLMQSARGGDPAPEKFDGLELMYSQPAYGAYEFNAAAFYNNTKLLGWNVSDVTAVGDLRLVGAELDVRRQTERWTVGGNHSYVKQVHFHPAAGTSGNPLTTNSDYTTTNPAVAGVGNDLNNWSNHATKLYTRVKMGKFTVHADARCYWGYQGMKDGLQVVQNAVAGTGSEAAVDAQADKLNARHYGDANYTANLSAEFAATERLSASVYLMNLSARSYKMYVLQDISQGGGTSLNQAFGFMEQPMAFGANLSYKF